MDILQLLPRDVYDASVGANAPSTSNVFITQNDLTSATNWQAVMSNGSSATITTDAELFVDDGGYIEFSSDDGAGFGGYIFIEPYEAEFTLFDDLGNIVGLYMIPGISNTFTDQTSSKGLEYADDYSANFTNESLVTKRYVDAQITAIPAADTIYTADDSLTGSRVVTMAANNLTFQATTGDFIVDSTSGSATHKFQNLNSGLNLRLRAKNQAGFRSGYELYYISATDVETVAARMKEFNGSGVLETFDTSGNTLFSVQGGTLTNRVSINSGTSWGEALTYFGASTLLDHVGIVRFKRQGSTDHAVFNEQFGRSGVKITSQADFKNNFVGFQVSSGDFVVRGSGDTHLLNTDGATSVGIGTDSLSLAVTTKLAVANGDFVVRGDSDATDLFFADESAESITFNTDGANAFRVNSTANTSSQTLNLFDLDFTSGGGSQVGVKIQASGVGSVIDALRLEASGASNSYALKTTLGQAYFANGNFTIRGNSDSTNLFLADEGAEKITIDGSLRIDTPTPSVIGQVWTATDALGNGSWQAAGSVDTIYTADNSLTGNRTVTLGANSLTFDATGTGNFVLNSEGSFGFQKILTANAVSQTLETSTYNFSTFSGSVVGNSMTVSGSAAASTTALLITNNASAGQAYSIRSEKGRVLINNGDFDVTGVGGTTNLIKADESADQVIIGTFAGLGGAKLTVDGGQYVTNGDFTIKGQSGATDLFFADENLDAVGINTTPSGTYKLEVAGSTFAERSVIVGTQSGSPAIFGVSATAEALGGNKTLTSMTFNASTATNINGMLVTYQASGTGFRPALYVRNFNTAQPAIYTDSGEIQFIGALAGNSMMLRLNYLNDTINIGSNTTQNVDKLRIHNTGAKTNILKLVSSTNNILFEHTDAGVATYRRTDFVIRGNSDATNLFFADEGAEIVQVGNAATTTSKLNVDGDIETAQDGNGLIVADATTGTRYRIYVDNGVLSTQLA